MPRSATKPQTDECRRRSSEQVIPPAPQELKKKDIIPGRFTWAQWTDMLIQEDADETVGEILDELLSKVMKTCLEVDIKRQLVPFTASWAKNYLTRIVEHQILCLDEGEGPEEGSKTEDSEPVPTTSEAWAQGCVPVLIRQPHLATQQEADISKVPIQKEARISQQCNIKGQTNSSPTQSEKETSPRTPVSDKQFEVLSPCLQPKTERKKKKHDNLPPKHVPRKSLPPLSCSTEKMRKNYQSIPRLDSSCLPQYSIFPQYEILDNNHTKPNSKKPSGLPRLEPKYNKQQTKWTVTPLEPLTNSKDHPAKRNEDDGYLKKSPSRHTKEQTVFPGSLRLDTMVLAKGVSLFDPEAVEISPLKFNQPSQSTKLRPIQSEVSVPLFSVDQVATGSPPQVNPLLQSKNCDS